MKVCSVVGIRMSGKTTVVTALVRELKRRGFCVGTTKTVSHPSFSLDDPKSNSAKHKAAGAEIVCIKSKNETDIIIPRMIEDNELLPNIHVDYLILEGDYDADVPRIICAHEEAEIEERVTEKTFAVSGHIADCIHTWKSYPVLHIVKEVEKLADLVEQIPDVSFPVSYLPPIPSVQAYEHSDPVVPYTRSRACKHVFLTGEKQIGKSTLLKRLIAESGRTFKGFQTRAYVLEGVKKGYYMHSMLPMEGIENDSPISVNLNKEMVIPILETFDTLGVKIVNDALAHPGIMVMDEIGRFEGKSSDFKKAILMSLNREKQVIGVLQKTHSSFIDHIKARDDVEVIEITRENRDSIYESLLSLLSE